MSILSSSNRPFVVAFVNERSDRYSACSFSRKHGRNPFRSQRCVLPPPTFVRLFPQYRRDCALLCNPALRTVAAAGTDVAVEEEASPANEEQPEAAASAEIPPPAADSAARTKRTRPVRKSEMPPVKNEELVPGAIFTGKVRSIQPFGAFIDFGAFTEGLVHVSRLSDNYVKDVGSVVSVGQEVKVKLLEANVENGRISLSMRENEGASRSQQEGGGGGAGGGGSGSERARPARKSQPKQQRKAEVKSSKFTLGQELQGTVKNIGRSGSFISLGEGEEGFLPMSEESGGDGYSHLMGESTLEAGQEVTVRVLRMSRGQVTLTMKTEEDGDAKMEMEQAEGVVHKATNPFVLAFRQNKELSAFLDERANGQQPEAEISSVASVSEESANVETSASNAPAPTENVAQITAENEAETEAAAHAESSPTEDVILSANKGGELEAVTSAEAGTASSEVEAVKSEVSNTASSVLETATQEVSDTATSTVETATSEVSDTASSAAETATSEIPDTASSAAEPATAQVSGTAPYAIAEVSDTASSQVEPATAEVSDTASAETGEPLGDFAEPQLETALNEEDQRISVSTEDGSEASKDDSVPSKNEENKEGSISPALVKQLREESGAGMMDCKKALTEAGGDIVKAQEFLRKKGLASAEKKASRATAEGRIGAYVHDSRIGVLVEVNCETDFVSRGDIFKELVDDMAMQIAACPQVQVLVPEDVPEEIVKKETDIEMQKEDLLSKPEQIRSKIVEGRIRKRLEEVALSEQPFIKNDKMTVKELVNQQIATIGENIKVKRFIRYNLGEGLEKKSQDFAAEVAAQTAAKTETPPPPPPAAAEKPTEEDVSPQAPTVAVSAALVKQLREETGAGMMDCKKALSESGGDLEKAQEYLRKKGLSAADKKSSRLAAEGRVGSYIHDSRIGVLIEVNCETDFVGRSENFKQLVDDLAMQVVACPQVQFVSIDDIPESTINIEKEMERQREDLQSKPENMRERIVEGRVAKRLGELALLEQPFIKDDSLLVKDLVKQTVAALGENIKVRRFDRFTLGEAPETTKTV